jgi:uncharacterized protein (TIGR00661 family)
MNTKKTVYFSACGIGLGHVGRLKPVVRWMHEKGYNVSLTGYGYSMDQVKNDKYSIHLVPEMPFYEYPNGSFNSLKTSLLGSYLILKFMRQAIAEYKLMIKYKPDLMVMDTRYSTLFAAKKYKMGVAPDLPLIFITNQLGAILPTPRQLGGIDWLEKGSSYLNIRIIGMADHVLVHDLPPPYTISTTKYQPPKWLQYRFKYIGFIIRNSPDQLPERKILRYKYTDDDKPLIFAPLAGPTVAREELMHLIIKALKKFDGKVIISIGKFGSNLDKKYGNVHVKGWLDDRFEVLKACDLTIARPGLGTITDFMRFGIPSILVPTMNHPEQQNNAESVQRLGAGKLLAQPRLSEKNLMPMVQDILTNKELKKSTLKMQQVMEKNDGLKNIKKLILSKLE